MDKIRAISFDCYGTLVDWEAGIRDAFTVLLQDSNAQISHAELLERFALHESRLEAKEPVISYSIILQNVAEHVATELGLRISPQQAEQFSQSVASWPLYADVIPTLRQLEGKYMLAILSNVDRKTFAMTEAKLENLVSVVCIAEEIGAYKPSLTAFSALQKELLARGIEQAEILHVAQSLYHDHEPAKRAGIRSCWVDRRHDQDGWGAVPAPVNEVKPDFRIRNLAELPGLLEQIG
jgi:2-haloacid dehalogenase